MLARTRPGTGDALRLAAELVDGRYGRPPTGSPGRRRSRRGPSDGGRLAELAGDGQRAVATTDARLVAMTGECAARNDRTPNSWEHVMPYGVRLHDQRRLLAVHTGRGAVHTGRGVL